MTTGSDDVAMSEDWLSILQESGFHESNIMEGSAGFM